MFKDQWTQWFQYLHHHYLSVKSLTYYLILSILSQKFVSLPSSGPGSFISDWKPCPSLQVYQYEIWMRFQYGDGKASFFIWERLREWITDEWEKGDFELAQTASPWHFSVMSELTAWASVLYDAVVLWNI